MTSAAECGSVERWAGFGGITRIVAEFMTTDNAARYLGVTPQRVRQLVAREEIKAQKLGRDYLLDSESVRSYGKTRRKPGRPKQ